jgi:hypothetical protein
LEQLLDQSPEAQWLYIREMNLHAGLAWDAGAIGENAECGMVHDGSAPESPPDAVAPPIPHSSFISHHWTSLAGSAVFSYTLAALLLGAGLLAGWAWRAPDGGPGDSAGRPPSAQLLARQPPQSAPSKAEPVAKITRMHGLKFGAWTSPAEAPSDPADVLAGCMYQIGPGTVEIAYRSGAKVVVEGPAEYLVESAHSGLLLLGSLRATVSQTHEARGGPAENPGVPATPGGVGQGRYRGVAGPAASPAAGALPTPLFVLRTRNAILESRNAQFTVRADAGGETQTDVVAGQVALSLPGYEVQETLVVRANGWAHVAGVAMGERLVVCNPGEPPEIFARRLPKGAPNYSNSSGQKMIPRQQQLLRSSVPDS